MALWSSEDKLKLLSLLQEHGTKDLQLIQQKLPHKTLLEIELICQKHQKLAMKQWHKKKEKKDDAVLRNWILIMKRIQNAQSEPVHDIIPRVLKYITLFEKRAESNPLNLTKCYQILADISAGKPLITGDVTHDYYINDCFSRLAKSIKDGEIRSCTKHLKSLQTLRNLNLHRGQNYSIEYSNVLNPLAIPEELLTMSENEKACGTI